MDRIGNQILSGFLAIEGLDGAGTTTQVRMASDRLKSLGICHFRTRAPTKGRIGQFIRSLLNSHQPISDHAFALLFAADRAEHLHGSGGVIEHVADGAVVISDRCVASSLAYQSLEAPTDYIEAINEASPLPERVIFLSIPVDICQARIRTRAEKWQRFDEAATQQRVLGAYQAALDRLQALGVTVHRIDGSGTKEQVFARLWPVLGFE